MAEFQKDHKSSWMWKGSKLLQQLGEQFKLFLPHIIQFPKNISCRTWGIQDEKTNLKNFICFSLSSSRTFTFTFLDAEWH